MINADMLAVMFTKATYGLSGFLILSILLNVFLFAKWIHAKRLNQEPKTPLRTPEKHVLEFLISQFNCTKEHNLITENRDEQLHNEVVQLRAAYLKIEEKALAKMVGSKPYWQHIDQNLLRLIKIICPKVNSNDQDMPNLTNRAQALTQRIFASSGSTNNKNMEECKALILTLLKQMHHHQGASEHLRINTEAKMKKLEAIVDMLENSDLARVYLLNKNKKEYIQNSERHIDQMDQISARNSSHIHALHGDDAATNQRTQELLRIKSENEALINQLRVLKLELNAFKNRAATHDSLLSITSSLDADRVMPYDITDVTQELIESNEREIGRLREVITKQRYAILDLESSISTLGPTNQTENSNRQLEVEKLKRGIYEYEICIQLLERELETLKSSIATLKQTGADNSLSPLASAVLLDDIKQLSASVNQSTGNPPTHQRNVFEELCQYASDALSASSIEDVSMLLYETIVNLNYMPILLIKTPDRILELSVLGEIPLRKKVMIDNMQINEVNPGAAGEFNFRFLQISGIIQPSSSALASASEGGDADTASDDQLIIRILKLSDKILSLAALAQKGRQQSKVKVDAINSIKKISYGLDEIIESHKQTTSRILNGSFLEISEIARVRGMTATQVATIKGIGQEAIKQIEAANTLRLKSRKHFLGLLNIIESS